MTWHVRFEERDPDSIVRAVAAVLARMPRTVRVLVEDETGALLDMKSAALLWLERAEREQLVFCGDCARREEEVQRLRALVAEMSRTMPLAELRASRAALVAEVGTLRAKVAAALSELS